MLKNYFKIAWRSLRKNKFFSLINITGFSLGMACSLLILLWVMDEYSVDAFHKNKNELFRIYEKQYFSGKVQGVIWTQGLLAENLKRDIPEIEMATAFSWNSKQVFSVGDKVNKQELNAAGPDFFKMFSFTLIEGNAENALNSKTSFAISKKMAEIFFGSASAAIGKTIRYDNRKDFTVTAVFENLPANSSLQFDCLQNWLSYAEDNLWVKNWANNDPLSFFKIRKGANSQIVAGKIKHFLDKYMSFPKGIGHTELAMQPFHEYYLNSNFKEDKIDGGRIKYVGLFSLVAIILLLIACINYMNLVTARSSQKSREVGICKVIGASRKGLVGQFFVESMLFTLMSVIIALIMVWIALPYFNQLTGKQIFIPINNSLYWLSLLGFILVIGVLSGIYPAIFLSSFKPIKVLKGRLPVNNSAIWFRKSLVVFQFGISIVMIIGMIVINRQMEFTQSKALGYNKSNLIFFPIEGDLFKNHAALLREMASIPSIMQTTILSESPANNSSGTEGIKWQGMEPNDNIRFTPLGVGYQFVKTMELAISAGRDFSKDYSTDSTAVLLNETAVSTMGLKNPVGQVMTMGVRKSTVVGVLKDYHYQSLHSSIRPMLVYLTKPELSGGNIVVRLNADKTKQALQQLEILYKKYNPKYPFSYQFTDEEYARLYKSDLVVSRLSDYFALIAIFIACLGLLGLALSTSEQRTKEIGIRKVLGASISSVLVLLSKDLLKLVIVSFLIASPIAWWAMQDWLQNFAYHIDLHWWYFAITGIFALLISFLTVSSQTIKVALTNPVKSLRTE